MKNLKQIIFKNLTLSRIRYSDRQIIAIDLDRTIIDNRSIVYKLLNIGVGSHKFISAVRNASQKHRAEIFDKDKVYKKSFINSLIGFMNPKKYTEVKDAVKYINKLYNQFDIFLVTSRPINSEFHRYLLSENIKNLGLKVDFVIANCADKGEFCRKLNADFLIDNCINYCVAADENGVTKAICFNDKHIGEHKKVLHLGNWESIYEYIKYVDMALKTQSNPYTTYKLRNDYREYLEKKICKLENVAFLTCRKFSKENTK